MNNELKPCPFCGYIGDYESCMPVLKSTLYQGRHTAATFTIYCQNCGATCGDCSSSDEAVTNWNVRA